MTDSTSASPRFAAMTRSLIALGAVLAMTACGEDPFAIPTSSTPPPDVTIPFSGSINRNGAVTHTFGTSASGTVRATLTALRPDNTQVIGMSLGTFNGNICSTVLSNDRSTEGTVITGGVSSLGSLCVRVYDVGTITADEPFTYELTIVGPVVSQ